jgi:tRNA(Ile)-lysidine synthase
VRERALVGPGDRVIVALSGGPDSVALLWALGDVLPAVSAELAGVAHLHHGLRGAEADEDEAFCRRLASDLQVPFDGERASVGTVARERGLSVEAAGHVVRYAFFERARVRLHATLVATGHTRNDQAETLLLRWLRGTGRRGLSGIRYAAGRVIRPLLDVARADVDAFLRARSLPFREDRSNLDLSIRRNRIRHELLPWLERHYAPRLVERLAAAAAIAADEEALLDRLTGEAAASVVLPVAGGMRLDLDRFGSLPPAIKRRVVQRVLQSAAGGRFIGTVHVEAVMGRIAAGDRGDWRLDLPGQRVERRGGEVVAARIPPEVDDQTASGGAPAGVHPPRPLPVPGQVEDLGGRWVVSAMTMAAGDRPGGDPAPFRAVVDAGRCEIGLMVRTRRPGDRFRPPGFGGHRKLQDYFVDRKVPRAQRDDVPIVVTTDGRIVWIAGHAISADFGVTPETTSVLLLKLRRSGG